MRVWIRDQHFPSGKAQKYGQGRSLRMKLGLVDLVAIVSIAILPATGFAGESEAKGNLDPVVKILVYNTAQAPAAALTEAEREAGRILSKAGVRAIWVECPPKRYDPESQAACQDGWGSINLGLRILVQPNSFADRLHGVPLGFAIFPALASVYYDHTLRFVGDDLLGLPRVLGCIIAHEIGHLLLGPNSHADQGLMQAGWGERQIRQARAGDLLFTSNQAKLIRAEAQVRMRLQTSTQARSSSLKLRFRNPSPSTVENPPLGQQFSLLGKKPNL